MAKDKELADHERAHNGKPGMKVRHGADATKQNMKVRREVFPVEPNDDGYHELVAETGKVLGRGWYHQHPHNSKDIVGPFKSEDEAESNSRK